MKRMIFFLMYRLLLSACTAYLNTDNFRTGEITYGNGKQLSIFKTWISHVYKFSVAMEQITTTLAAQNNAHVVSQFPQVENQGTSYLSSLLGV